METILHATVKQDALTPDDCREMFALMSRYYLGVTREGFQQDLAEKEHVILLREPVHGHIVGFSTLVRLDMDVRGERVEAIFSGDTIVEECQRHTLGLGQEITRYFTRTLEEFPLHDVFYVLISKGWRTYRVPMLLFREFSPAPDRAVPQRHREVMDAFGMKKYPEAYQPATGIITHAGEAQRIRPGSSEALPGPRTSRTIQWFVKRNPNYLQGDELVTVAQVAEWNYSPACQRLLRSGAASV